MNFPQGVGVYFDGGDPVKVFAVVLEDDAAFQAVGKVTVLIWVENNGMGESKGAFIVGAVP